MPQYEIEMLWECSVCRKAGNRGLKKHCAGCGHPKSEKDREYFPDDITEANAIQGPKTSTEPDWKCKYCDSLQSADNACCDECGCNKATGERDWMGKELSVHENADRSGRRESSRDVHVEPHKPVIDVDPQPGVVRQIRFSEREVPAKKTPWGFPGAPYFLVAAFVGAIIFIIYALFIKHEVNSGVRSVAWKHTVHVERYKLLPEDGWTVPSGAEQVQNLGSRYHYTDHRIVGHHKEPFDDPQPCGHICGPKPSCYTTPRNCTSQKNGKASCSGGDRVCPPADCSQVKYCPHTSYRTVDDYQDFPIYDPYYSWMEWHWVHDRDLVKQGATTDTVWPTEQDIHLNQGLGDRESERSTTEEWYEVTLGHHGKLWKFTPKTDAEFRLYPVGSRHEIKVNLAGQVEIVRHGR